MWCGRACTTMTSSSSYKHSISYLLSTAPSSPLSLPLPAALAPLPPSLVSPLTPPSSPGGLPSLFSPGSATLRCRLCTFSASTAHALSFHLRTVHQLKPFACRACNKTFAERGNANKHYRVAHLKQRNHRCPTCGRSFAFRDGLNRHIAMVHLNQRPWTCTECMCPNGPHGEGVECTHVCGMSFKQKSHRRRHIMSVHHGGGRRNRQRKRTGVEELQGRVQKERRET